VTLRYAKILLRCLPLCLLALVFWREKPWQVELSSSAPWAMAAVVLLNFGVFLPIKAARWRVALVDPPPFRQVLAATMEGLLANAALGFGSGDVVRSARLREHTQRLTGDYACTWAERGAEVIALAILVSGRWLLPRLGRWPRLRHALSSGLSASTPKRVATMVALSLVGWGSEVAMLLLFQSAFHLRPSLDVALLTLVGINAAIVIPTLPGNFGTFEAGAIMALVMCGVPRDVAVLYALTYHLTHVIPVTVAATTVYLVRSHRRSAGRPRA
jgi:uncharacterized membrane protein YbhN (UPF0104 family)